MNRWVHLGFVVLAVLFLGAIVMFRIGDAGQGAPADAEFLLDPRPLQGPAAALSLPARDGNAMSLKDFRGKAVLLNFWATWCKPCLQELPHIATLARRVAGRPMVLVLVSVDESWEDVTGMATKILSSHPARQGPWKDAVLLLRGKIENVIILLDPSSKSAETYGTAKYPETYLIDQEGNLKMKFIGPKPWGEDAVVDFLGSVLSEK